MSKMPSYPSTWKGENVGIKYKHQYLRKKYGNPPACEFCGIKGEFKFRKVNNVWTIHYALKRGRRYSRYEWDYLKLCNKCHAKYDSETCQMKKKEEYEKRLLPPYNNLITL